MPTQYSYEDYLKIIEKLRAKDGCPWDREQTHESLRTCLLEEAYEVVEAINMKDDENLVEELGDVLLQIVMHATIAKEEDRFTMDDIIQSAAEKMIRRHPHVFGDAVAEDAKQVLDNWDAIKQKEKKEAGVRESAAGVPKALPANIRAAKVQKKAAGFGFEFKQTSDVMDKVREEIKELENSMADGNKDQIMEEFGDVMFSLINLSRFLDINAENSLTNATEKFINRLGSIENLAKNKGFRLSDMTLEELDDLWNEVKTIK